jgi:N-acetylmuramoyl-L-alanine amidase
MARPALLCAVALVLAAAHARAAPPAKEMYETALGREQSVRADLDGRNAARLLPEIRSIAIAYDALVRRYPRSGYCDDALWQAGHLLLDAFARFGEPRDRKTGVRLLKNLAAEYPTSRLAARVPGEIARLDALDRGGPERAAARAAAPGAPPPVATIRAIRRAVLPDAVRVTIELDAEVAFRGDRLAGPDRVYVDLSPARASRSLVDETLRFESDLVRQIRLGRHPDSRTRVVLDTTGVSDYSVYPLYNPFRLVIDCLRERREREAPVLSARPWRAMSGLPVGIPANREAIDQALALPVRPPVGGPQTPPAPTLASGISMARQLGLGVSRIVIDPGHGGHDPGAQSRGVTESALVLDVALRLEALLRKIPGVDVVLTRRTDEYVSLQERTAIANRHGADLFLSIHANASENPRTRGIETFFLNFATSLSASAVAARENAASGQAMGALPDFVKAIALNNKLDESREFATLVQWSLVDRLEKANRSVKDLGVKQAPFLVLIGAAMPSVLTEISFVTNAQDARLLKSASFRQQVAEALRNAVRRYQMALTEVGTVAHH